MQDFKDNSQQTFVNPPPQQPVPPVSPQWESQPLQPFPREQSQWESQPPQPLPTQPLQWDQPPQPPLPQQPAPSPQPKKAGMNWIWYAAGGVVLCGILVCLAYFAGVDSNQQKNGAAQPPAAEQQSSTEQNAAPASTTPETTPAATPDTQPPAAATTPASTPATQPAETPAQQTPAQPTYTVPANSIDPTVVITRQAYQMVLALDDIGTGWAKSSAASPSRGFVYSSSHVIFSQGSSYAPVLQNMVTVYRTIDAAADAYQKEVPTGTAGSALSHPSLGNECFLNDAVANNKVLVFRKNNVVVWIQLQQDKTGDPVYYAQIVDQKVIP